MKCSTWKDQTSVLIREEKWSYLTQPYDCSCRSCNKQYRIEKMFIKEGKFSIEAQDAALYLNKNNKLDWAEAIICSPPLTMEKLRDVVESGLIDVNYSSHHSLAGMFMFPYVPYWKDALKYLFEKGCSIDIQDNDGYSILMSANAGCNYFVSIKYDYDEEYDFDEHNDHNYNTTKFLLEQGADPFLETKKGCNIISYAKKYFSVEDQERLFQLIEEYEEHSI